MPAHAESFWGRYLGLHHTGSIGLRFFGSSRGPSSAQHPCHKLNRVTHSSGWQCERRNMCTRLSHSWARFSPHNNHFKTHKQTSKLSTQGLGFGIRANIDSATTVRRGGVRMPLVTGPVPSMPDPKHIAFCVCFNSLLVHKPTPHMFCMVYAVLSIQHHARLYHINLRHMVLYALMFIGMEHVLLCHVIFQCIVSQ